MSGIILSIVFVSFLGLLIGIFKPKSVVWWSSQKTRVKAVCVYGLVWFASTMVLGVLKPDIEKGAATDQEVVYVIAAVLNLRSQPNTHSEIIAKLPRKTKVTIQEEDDGWIFVGLEDGRNGWVNDDYVGTLEGADQAEIRDQQRLQGEKTQIKQEQMAQSSFETETLPPKDLTKFKINIHNSDLYFDVSIVAINITDKANAFVSKEYQYGPDVHEDGYVLSVSFAMHNPYDKIYEIPVPDYYRIASSDPDFQRLPKIKRGMRWGQTYGQEKFGLTGSPIKISDTHRKPIRFEPKETKKFTVTFPPILDSIDHVVMYGFVSEKAGSIHRKNIGIYIDIALQKIVKWVEKTGEVP